MNSFEYASPRTEEEAVLMLSAHDGNTAVLAGGTDLFSLLRARCIAPSRVVDIKNIASIQGVSLVSGGVMIGALTTLDEILVHPLLSPYESLRHVADAVHAIQVQSSGTLGAICACIPIAGTTATAMDFWHSRRASRSLPKGGTSITPCSVTAARPNSCRHRASLPR